MGTRRRAISAASRKRHRLGTLRATHNQARLPRITRGFLRDLRVIYRETLRLQLRNALGMHFICPQRGLRDLKRFWVGLETPRPLRFSHSLARASPKAARPRSTALSLSQRPTTIPRLPPPNAKTLHVGRTLTCETEREQSTPRTRRVCTTYVVCTCVCVGRDALLPTPGRRAGSLSTIPNYECMAGLGVLARYEQDAVSSRTNN